MISDVATIRTKMRQTQTAKRSVTIQNERYHFADRWIVLQMVRESTGSRGNKPYSQHKRSPITSATGSTQCVPRISTAEHKKLSKIKYLHPFKHEVVPFMLIDYIFLYTLLMCLKEQC
ncbi:hypothetical protein ZEAMMB73_Zm00001d014714 [Zea mays]|uniref:Uncharacterized protein n=1 Tax=Zea mays TaxID=4577 RepID=A0A1D6GVM1_MAIZE|nr:hypothetical protein ZEAMMB73_Zm00001d014714 [Zea mays]